MPEDMRNHPRFPVQNTVFLELVSPEFGSKDAGTIARGKTLDVSRSGLLVSLNQDLLVGTILQVALELPGGNGTLYLVGEVRWCLPVPGTGTEPGWSAGLSLLNAEDSDIDNWIALMTTMED